MSEAKHTPGPWETFPITPAANDRVGVQSKSGPLVADCGLASNAYSEANAKLIAAAPALLAALQAFIPELEQRERFISANDSPWSQSERDMLHRIGAARKAVKDAGGEA